MLSKLSHYFFLVVGFSSLISTDEIAEIPGSGANLPYLAKSQSLCHKDISFPRLLLVLYDTRSLGGPPGPDF